MVEHLALTQGTKDRYLQPDPTTHRRQGTASNMTDPDIALIEITDRVAAALGDTSFAVLENNDHTNWPQLYPLGKIIAPLNLNWRLIQTRSENLALYGQWIDIADAIQLSS